MNKFEIEDWSELFWNGGSDWAIPLPEFPEIKDRWFVANESPAIPTGWIYRLPNGEIVIEARL